MLRDVWQMYLTLFTAYPILFAAMAGVLGLFLGSFLNVVALRIPKGESMVYPPSHCTSCKHRLGAMDLIPVFSYVFLRGKCRYCRSTVSPIYPLGEALAAFWFALIAWKLGPCPEWIAGLFLAAIVTAITVTDLKYMLIPDKIVLFAVSGGLLLRLWTRPLPLWDHLTAMVLGGALLYLIAWLSIVLLKKEGMGGGDIKLFTFIGLMLGIKLTLLTLFTASLLGTIFGLLQLTLNRMDRNKPLPFGPFIGAGALGCYLWGNRVIDWYVGFLH